MRQRPATAVLLAAGRGKRQRPYTDRVPKPLLPVQGRPTLDFVLTAAAEAGIENICLVTHHLSEQIEAYVADGAAWNLKAATCRQETLLGTADALKAAVNAYPQFFDDGRPFVLTATDYLLPPDYLTTLVDAFQAAGTDMAFSLKELSRAQILASSSVRYGTGGHIVEVIEKPAEEDVSSPYSASLTFVLPAGLLPYLRQMRPSPRGEYEIQSVINEMLRDGFTASGCVQETPPEWEPGML